MLVMFVAEFGVDDFGITEV